MQKSEVRPGFLVAWTLLIVVITLGFFIQARLIDQVHQQQDAVLNLITGVEHQRQMDLEAICTIMLTTHPGEQTKVYKAFADAGIPCVTKGAGNG